MPTLVPSRRPLVAVALLLLAACSGDPTSALAPAVPRLAIAPESVTVADLGAPAGETEVNPVVASEAGDVLATGSSVPVYIYRGGAWAELTGFGVPISPRAINNAGDIVVAAIGTSVILVRRGGVTSALPVLGSGDYAAAFDINNAGVVAGSHASEATGVIEAALWRPGADAPELLPALPGGSRTPGTRVSVAYAINDAGQVVGESFANARRAVLWENGIVRDLGTLGGEGGAAVDINERGDVVGLSYTAAGQLRPFIWRAGVMTELGTIGEGLTFVVAINDAGQVIGNAGNLGSGPLRGVVWEDGVLTPLEPLPGYARSAVVAITNDGRIIGRSFQRLEPGIPIGRATVWTVPIPPGGEPPHEPPHGPPHQPPHAPPHHPPHTPPHEHPHEPTHEHPHEPRHEHPHPPHPDHAAPVDH